MVRQRTKNTRVIEKKSSVHSERKNDSNEQSMDEVKKKAPSNEINDENAEENLINLKVSCRIYLIFQ